MRGARSKFWTGFFCFLHTAGCPGFIFDAKNYSPPPQAVNPEPLIQ